MNRQLQSRLLRLALVGIALRAIVPAGYMPAPIADGLPFVLCPGGLSGAAFFIAADASARHGHVDYHGHGHGHGTDQRHDEEVSLTWEFCPFGAAFGGTGLIAEPIAALTNLDYTPPAAEPDSSVQFGPIRAWRARAPPTNQSIDA